MYAELRETASELAAILWREHTVYRERGGGVVIRGEHVRRWISLAPTGGKDRALLRAGRILDGGTTAPARTEVVVDLTAGTAELAAVCRGLLADVAAAAEPAPGRGGRAGRREKPGRGTRAPRSGRRSRGERHTGAGSLFVMLCVAAVFGAWLYGLFGGRGH
ncbi:hypothetical protein [Streptomyces sp. NPDC001744]|uniref:hypothetical protein n=1 Tax=Streptomyces sp. NPDC001744 TaxID=3364606 RepID=UPI0036790222